MWPEKAKLDRTCSGSSQGTLIAFEGKCGLRSYKQIYCHVCDRTKWPAPFRKHCFCAPHVGKFAQAVEPSKHDSTADVDTDGNQRSEGRQIKNLSVWYCLHSAAAVICDHYKRLAGPRLFACSVSPRHSTFIRRQNATDGKCMPFPAILPTCFSSIPAKSTESW